jgi:hypothetical protein
MIVGCGMLFSLPVSWNDINVLHRSLVFNNPASSNAPAVKYIINGREYNIGYYLCDFIYPPWVTLIIGVLVSVRKQAKFVYNEASRVQERC